MIGNTVTKKHYVKVACPKCNEEYLADASLGAFNCPKHGDFAFVILQPDVEEINRKLKILESRIEDNGLEVSREEFSRALADIRAEAVKLSTYRAPEAKYSFQEPKFDFVDRRMVDDLNEAFQEAGFVLSMFTLFLGITIDKIIDQKPAGILIVVSIIFGLITFYAYYKGYQRKRNIEKEMHHGQE